jgi:hypothetical protein
MAPYGRILNHTEAGQGEPGTFGFPGPRTEQFALGSLYYLINDGFEVYGDRCLTEDPYDHSPKVVRLLQNMEFPKLASDPLVDDVIDKCWHNEYTTVSDLAAHTKKILHESPDRAPQSTGSMGTEQAIGDSSDELDGNLMGDDFPSKRNLYQDLEQRGLLQFLLSGEREEIGFTLAWYRHCL